MKQRIERLLRDERGNLVEYLIVIGLVALLAIGAFQTFGGKISTKIGNQGKAVDSITDTGASKTP
jgi:Flp pilus assembly pilin Flp